MRNAKQTVRQIMRNAKQTSQQVISYAKLTMVSCKLGELN